MDSDTDGICDKRPQSKSSVIFSHNFCSYCKSQNPTSHKVTLWNRDGIYGIYLVCDTWNNHLPQDNKAKNG